MKEEVGKLREALELVEKYEKYLFRKSFGVLLIVIGILGPLTGLLTMNAEPIATHMGISETAFVVSMSAITWIIGFTIVIRSFASATILLQKKRKVSFRKDAPHIVAICLVWFIFFFSVNLAPAGLMPVALLWAAGSATLLIYLIVRRIHGAYPELLITGLALLIASIPITAISDLALAGSVSMTAFGASFCIGGAYSTMIATRALGKSG
jgi:hypothetical protein